MLRVNVPLYADVVVLFVPASVIDVVRPDTVTPTGKPVISTVAGAALLLLLPRNTSKV